MGRYPEIRKTNPFGPRSCANQGVLYTPGMDTAPTTDLPKNAIDWQANPFDANAYLDFVELAKRSMLYERPTRLEPWFWKRLGLTSPILG